MIENLIWAPITDSLKDQLCLPFQESEIHSTLRSFANNKTPGPDGFTIEFLKKHWKILKQDIKIVFVDFFQKGIINNIVNETYIALIAKKEKCSKALYNIPISLTTTLYKLIAKTMTERLKVTLSHTISDHQMAFVKERQITDAILIANEAIDYWKVKKTRGFVIKLDIAKAFDKINWSFIDYMLMKKNYSGQSGGGGFIRVLAMYITQSSSMENPGVKSNLLEAYDKVIHFLLSYSYLP